MDEARVERRLAAILAADVAGYSRLMGVDEEGTLRQLKAHRKELIDPKIIEHRGHIVKTTGGGMLVEFVSVVDAVRCAVGNRVRITAQLFDAATNNHIWADRYDGDLTDVFELLDEIKKNAVAAIEPKLLELEGMRKAALQ